MVQYVITNTNVTKDNVSKFKAWLSDRGISFVRTVRGNACVVNARPGSDVSTSMVYENNLMKIKTTSEYRKKFDQMLSHEFNESMDRSLRNTAYVGELPVYMRLDHLEIELSDYFSKYGNVVHCECKIINHHRENEHKIAYVTFEDEESLDECTSTRFQMFGDSRIYVQKVKQEKPFLRDERSVFLTNIPDNVNIASVEDVLGKNMNMVENIHIISNPFWTFNSTKKVICVVLKDRSMVSKMSCKRIIFNGVVSRILEQPKDYEFSHTFSVNGMKNPVDLIVCLPSIKKLEGDLQIDVHTRGSDMIVTGQDDDIVMGAVSKIREFVIQKRNQNRAEKRRATKIMKRKTQKPSSLSELRSLNDVVIHDRGPCVHQAIGSIKIPACVKKNLTRGTESSLFYYNWF
jgi:hypothetical protein